MPGAATEKEDPALFEVLSRNVGSREKSPVKELKDQDTSQILEIESHLIESLSEADNVRHSTSCSGVDIDELPPAEDELEKNSQVESETSPKSVIEVEPAVPKVLQTVEVQLEAHSIGVATIILESELSEKQDSLEAPALVNQLVKTNKHFETNCDKGVDENFNSKGEVNGVIEEKKVVEEGFVEEQVPVETTEVPQTKNLTVEEEVKKEAPEVGGVIEDIKVDTTEEAESGEKKEEVKVPGVIEDIKLDSTKEALKKVEDNKVIEKASIIVGEKKEQVEVPKVQEVIEDIKVDTTKETTPGEKKEEVKVQEVIEDIKLDTTKEAAPENNKKEELEKKSVIQESSIVSGENKEDIEVQAVIEEIEVNTTKEAAPEAQKEKVEEKSLTQESTKVSEEEKEEVEVLIQNHLPSIYKEEVTKEEIKPAPETKKEVKQEHLSIDINGLPLPSTPLEEEEKKKFLDSIPQLENRSDSVAVSKQAKKEYYQSLRKYLIDEEENKPPVPLLTYRWEDLRRAKERVSFWISILHVISLIGQQFVLIDNTRAK